MIRRFGFLLLLLVSPGLAAQARFEPGQIHLEPPGERDFVVDRAGLLDAATEQRLRALADRLLTEKATPIVVVTLESMAQYGGAGMRIETFARLLFDQWGIGWEKLGNQSWNTGILLLVSRDDRRARIELGAGWRREQDTLCQRILEEQVLPQFKRGDFALGISKGVESLDSMARGLGLPSPPRPFWQYAVLGIWVAITLVSLVSFIQSGSQGWAWAFWGSIGSFLFFMARRRSSSSGGRRGFSRGSFGRGSSGGGGATGSW